MNQMMTCYRQYINSESYEAETEALLVDLYAALDEADGKMLREDFLALEDAVSEACAKIEKRAFYIGFQSAGKLFEQAVAAELNRKATA